MVKPANVPEVLAAWERVAQRKGLTLHPNRAYLLGVAQIVVDGAGACPCAPAERPTCPCALMVKDIAAMGCCHCGVFRDPKWRGEYGVVR